MPGDVERQGLDMNTQPTTTMTPLSTRRRVGTIAGIVIALAVPVSNLLVAQLWSAGVLQLDPDGWLVQALEAPGLGGVFLGPIGLFIAAWSARVRFDVGFALVVVLVPLLVILWFVAVASLGGMAGEPF
jgi:hypothetical protein